jgi:hypothetical protein
MDVRLTLELLTLKILQNKTNREVETKVVAKNPTAETIINTNIIKLLNLRAQEI